MDGLELSGQAIVKKWISLEIEGCITALRMPDVAGDGLEELVVAIGAEGSGLFKEPRGSVQFFEFITRWSYPDLLTECPAVSRRGWWQIGGFITTRLLNRRWRKMEPVFFS